MHLNDLDDVIEAIEQIETELGVDPSGVYTNIRARLDILESRINNPNAPSPTVENPFIIGNSGVSISTGIGAPTSTTQNGSIYLRQDGSIAQALYSRRNGAWELISAGSGSFIADGDLTGNEITQMVIGIQGNPVPIPSGTNTTLIWSGSTFSWGIISGFTAGGDLSGNSTSQTVIKINGATVPASGSLTTGNVLKVTGSNTLSYGPINLAGGSDHVTGTLPTTNQVAQSLGGDLSGTTTTGTVLKINGATAPSAGSLVTGNVLQVTGASALSYAAINLAGGSNFVTGVLPTANQASQSLGGDLSGTTSSATVGKINGSTVPAGGALTTGTVLRATGVATLAYGAVDLANNNAVTGILPTANQAAQSLGGDLSGTTTTATVIRINGSTVPAGGALTTGNVLRVSGVGALSYAAVNLAGGVDHVTGTLPAANQAAQSMGGDASGTTASTTVTGIRGNSVPSPTGTNTVLNWNGSAFSWATNSAFTAGGDLSGTSSSQTVLRINGTSIPSGPSANRVLTATSGTTAIWSQIFDGYVASNAAISGTKISPAFGSQNITNTGTIAVGSSTGTNVITGANRFTTRSVTTTLTIDTTTTDMILLCNLSGATTVTLPPPTNGRTIMVKDVAGNFSTNNLTLAPNSTEEIEGIAGSRVFNTDFQSFIIVSDGTEWYIL